MKSFASKERSSQVKVAFTTSGNDLNAPLDSRFGRAAKFLVYNLDTNAFMVIDNQQNLDAAQGAGIQSAETVARSGASALVETEAPCVEDIPHSGSSSACKMPGKTWSSSIPLVKATLTLKGGRTHGNQRA